jgi:hypothetical protein
VSISSVHREETAMHDMPKPGAEHLKLHRLVGTWEGPEKLAPSPWGPGGDAVGRTVCRLATDGFTVVGDYQETKAGAVVFRGLSVFTVDPQSQEALWFWFDSMGMPPAGGSRGRWEGDRLVFHSVSPQGHGRYTFELFGADRYTFKLEGSTDGKAFKTQVEGDYRRVG